jgi:hypothetical protein
VIFLHFRGTGEQLGAEVGFQMMERSNKDQLAA